MDREQWIHHIKSLRDTYSNMLLDLERGNEERVVFTVEAGIYRYDLDIDEDLNDIDIIYKIDDGFQIADIRLARVYLLKGLTKVMVKLEREGHTLKELDVDKDSIYDPIRATFNSENGFISCYARLNKIVL